VNVNAYWLSYVIDLNFASLQLGHDVYLGQRLSLFSSKVIVHTHRHTHWTDYSTWTTKVVGEKVDSVRHRVSWCLLWWWRTVAFRRWISLTRKWTRNIDHLLPQLVEDSSDLLPNGSTF